MNKTAKKITKYTIYASTSIVLAMLYYSIFSPFIDTPREHKLRKQYEQMEKSYDSIAQSLALTSDVLSSLQWQDTMIYRAIFKTNPVGFKSQTSAKEQEIIHSMQNEHLSTLVNKSYLTLQNLSTQINAADKQIKHNVKILKDSTILLDNIPAIQPVRNKDLKRTGAATGMKIHPFYRVAKMHKGIDFAVPIGTEVFATANGQISSIQNNDQEKGTIITINHGNGYKTVYAHLSKVSVKAGEKVTRGKIIALSGDTGTSIWPHLHYEIWKNDKICNPLAYFFLELNPSELKTMSDIANNNGQSLD